MDAFEAFPNAITTWTIAKMAYGTIRGNQLTNPKSIRVIVDEGENADQTNAPGAASIASDTLLYAMPADLPTTDTSSLVADYAIKDPQNRTYAIIDAGAGKNQHTGRLEHIELRIRPIGGFDESE